MMLMFETLQNGEKRNRIIHAIPAQVDRDNVVKIIGAGGVVVAEKAAGSEQLTIN